MHILYVEITKCRLHNPSSNGHCYRVYSHTTLIVVHRNAITEVHKTYKTTKQPQPKIYYYTFILNDVIKVLFSEECACKFCGCAGVDKFHLLRCEWASCEQMNMDNIQQIVNVLHACNRHT